MNRRALLLGSGAAALLAGCSVKIEVELPRIQASAGRITAWLVKKLGTIPLLAPLLGAVKAENDKVQAYKVSDGWGPIMRDLLAGFVKAAQAVMQLAAMVYPPLGPVLAIAGKVISAISAYSSMAGAVGDVPPSLDEADALLKQLEA